MAISKINNNSVDLTNYTMEATDGCRISFIDTGQRHYSIGNEGTAFTIADESAGGLYRFAIGNTGDAFLYSQSTGTIGCIYDSGAMRFSIGNSGGFATTTAGLWIGGYATDGVGYGRMNFSKTTSGTVNGIEFYHAGSNIGGIDYTNTSVAYNTSSDYRLKENIITITDGIERLKQLNPIRFNFIADTNTTVDGFIAHEAQAVVPEAVTGVKDEVDEEGNPEYQGIDQSKLVPLLTAALQEAVAKIEALEARVAALENA